MQSLCFLQSNRHYGLSDRYLFGYKDLTERNELKDLSLVFEARGDLHAAIRLACLNAREDKTRDAWPANLQRVDNLASQMLMSTACSDLYRALWAQLFVAKLIVDRDITANVESRIGKCLSIMNTLRVCGLECPDLNMELRMVKLDQMPLTLTNLMETLLLADEAHQDQNYQTERRCLLRAGSTLKELSRAKLLDEQQRTILQQVVSRRLHLEEEVCQSIYYEAWALASFRAPTYIALHEDVWYIAKCSELFKRTPEPLDLPQIVYHLAKSAEDAARAISDKQARKRFQRDKLKAQIHCPFAEHRTDFSFSMTAEARNNSSQIHVGVYSPDRRTMLQNAVGQVIEWAIAALGQLPDSVRKVLLDGYTDSISSLRTVSDAHMMNVVSRIFGSADQPTDDETWHTQFDVVESWLRDGCEASIEETRHWILLTLQQSRWHTLVQKRLGQHGLTDDALLEAIYRAKLEEIRIVESITFKARGPDPSIQATLLRTGSIMTLAGSITAIKDGRMTDAMLESVMETLGDQLCDYFRDTGNSVMTYICLYPRAAAASMRYICFKSVEPDAGLDFLEAADQIYSQLRRQASSAQFLRAKGSKSQSLDAKVQLVKSLNHDKVYARALNDALLAWYVAGQNPWAEEKRQMFSKWVERSKARNLLDELGVGSHVPKRHLLLAASQEDYEDMTEEQTLLGELKQSDQREHIAEQMQVRRNSSLHHPPMQANVNLKEIAALRDGTTI